MKKYGVRKMIFQFKNKLNLTYQKTAFNSDPYDRNYVKDFSLISKLKTASTDLFKNSLFNKYIISYFYINTHFFISDFRSEFFKKYDFNISLEEFCLFFNQNIDDVLIVKNILNQKIISPSQLKQIVLFSNLKIVEDYYRTLHSYQQQKNLNSCNQIVSGIKVSTIVSYSRDNKELLFTNDKSRQKKIINYKKSKLINL